MTFSRIALALAAVLAVADATAADLVTLYRDALVSDPLYQSARAQYQATTERLPQARSGYLPQISGAASIFRNHSERDGAADRDYNTKTVAITLSQLPAPAMPTELIYCFDVDGPGPAVSRSDHCDHVHAGYDG